MNEYTSILAQPGLFGLLNNCVTVLCLLSLGYYIVYTVVISINGGQFMISCVTIKMTLKNWLCDTFDKFSVIYTYKYVYTYKQKEYILALIEEVC